MLVQRGLARRDADWKIFATSGLTEKETTGTHLQGTASSKKGLQGSQFLVKLFPDLALSQGLKITIASASSPKTRRMRCVR